MSTKPTKPKARRMWLNTYPDGEVFRHYSKKAARLDAGIGATTIPMVEIDLSDEAALIDALARAWVAAISKNLRLKVPMLASDHTRANARAALTALGVLPKRKSK